MTTFPSEIYEVYATYGTLGLGGTDPTPEFAEALDHFIALTAGGKSPRVLCITFDLETNLPETVADVTEEFETAAAEEAAA